MPKITIKRFKIAVENSGGILTAVSKRLKVSRNCLYEFIAKNEEARELLKEERETIIDMAESSLFKQVQKEEQWATKFLLSTIGKSRGYADQEQTVNIQNAPGSTLAVLSEMYHSTLLHDKENKKNE